MSDHATRRRVLSAAGAFGATAPAGCAGVTCGNPQTETAMEADMEDGMTKTMTGEAMDDEMTDTMFVESNDLFYAPDPSGLPLWNDGEPVNGEFTDALALWDAGTEVNQEPGAGPDQAPRQDGTDTGESEDGVVRRMGNVDDGYDYPDVNQVVRLTVTPVGMDG